MSWLNKILGDDGNVTVEYRTTPPPEIRRGLPVYESEIQGQKLARRELNVSCNGEEKRLPISTLRAQFYAGLLPGDAQVLVTSNYSDVTQYCGEGTVAGVVAAWESAPLEDYDRQDCNRMIEEFGLPAYDIPTKSAYDDLSSFYGRCDKYYRHIEANNREFKRLTKAATRDMVFMLDESQPGWDSSGGVGRFEDEVRRRHPELLRTEGKKRAKKKQQQEQKLEREERKPLIDTRNYLTEFPDKKMQIEVKDLGLVEIRAIKPRIRDGTMTTETPVRHGDLEWMELYDFLHYWMRVKATQSQISYLRSLQQQHGITTPIPADMSRSEASERISALAPERT